MKKPLSYSTKYIDNALTDRKSAEYGIDLKETLYQRLDQRIAEQAYDWIINSLRDLFLWYAGDGDVHMQLDVDKKAAKENYYIAALIGALCYEMIEKGFSHHFSLKEGAEMTYDKYQEYMRNFFEQYYQKLSREEICVTLPLEEAEKEMWSDDADPNDEWKKWKLIPAMISDEEIKELEKEIGVELPLSLKAFLTVTHHCFDYPIGRNSVAEHFEGVRKSWNPVLVRCGYLPFAWDKESYFIRCIRLEKCRKKRNAEFIRLTMKYCLILMKTP